MTAARQPRGEGEPETERMDGDSSRGEGVAQRHSGTGVYELPTRSAHLPLSTTSETTIAVDSCDRDREYTLDGQQPTEFEIPPTTTQDIFDQN